LEIHIHGIPYIATFIVLQNNVVDFNYSTLLGKPWLEDAKVIHDWGNNVIIVQGNGIVKAIYVNKNMGVETRKPQVFFCYDLMERLTIEKENLIFETEPKLFLICTIIILDEIISLLNIGVSKIKVSGEFDLEQQTSN